MVEHGFNAVECIIVVDFIGSAIVAIECCSTSSARGDANNAGDDEVGFQRSHLHVTAGIAFHSMRAWL